MTTRNTTILAAVTLLTGVFVLAFERGPRGGERDFSAIPSVSKAEEIAALKITSGSGDVTLERDGEKGWKMTTPVKDRADAEKVEALVATLIDLKKFESMEEGAPSDAAMGLDDAALKIVVTNKEGASGTLSFGDDAGVEGAIYARWDDGAPFVCWRDARDLAEVPSDSLRDIRLLGVTIDEMRRFKIKDVTEASVVINREGDDGPWLITKPLSTPADQKATEARINQVTSIGARGFIDNPSGEASSAFAAGAITVSVWRVGAKGATELRLAKSADGKSGFAKLSDREATFAIDPRFVDLISLDPNDYRTRSLVAFNPKSVLRLQIAAKPDHEVKLAQDNTGWQLLNPTGKVPASRQRVLRMLKDLATEEVVDFVADAVPDADLGKWGLDSPHLAIHLTVVKQDPETPLNADGQPNLLEVPLSILISRFVPEDQPAVKLFATVVGSGTVVELGPAFPSVVPIRPLDYRSLYLWPSFARERLVGLNTSRPPLPPLQLKYLGGINDWTGTQAGADVSARINKAKALTLTQELSLPLRASRWVTQGKGEAMIALQRPVRSLEFELKDQTGKLFRFGLDIAPVNNNMRAAFFYARPLGSDDICMIDRATFELLNGALLSEAPAPPAAEPEQ